MKLLAINDSKLIDSIKSVESLLRKILSVHLMSIKFRKVKSLEIIAHEIGGCIR